MEPTLGCCSTVSGTDGCSVGETLDASRQRSEDRVYAKTVRVESSLAHSNRGFNTFGVDLNRRERKKGQRIDSCGKKGYNRNGF